MEIEDTALCKMCNQYLPFDNFYVRDTGALQKNRCKSCVQAYNRKRYDELPGEKEKRRLRAMKYKEDPDKVLAAQERSTRFYASIPGRAKTLFKSATRRASKFKEILDIDVNFIQKRLEQGYCEVTKIEFDFAPHPEYDKNPYSPSIDRIDSNKGYTKENTQIVIWQYNLMKGEITKEELLTICKILVEENSG